MKSDFLHEFLSNWLFRSGFHNFLGKMDAKIGINYRLLHYPYRRFAGNAH